MTMVESLAVCVLLVNICWAAPAPSTNDVLSGQDFLAVFMRSSQRTRSVPSSYYINRNLIQHNKDGVDYELDRDDHRIINEDNVISSTTITKSTHIEKKRVEPVEKKHNEGEPNEEIVEHVEDEEEEEEEVASSTSANDDLTTTDLSLITTTEQPSWETDTELPSQVVSVRVSSSVVRQRPRLEEKPGIATTQDEPGLTAAAVQRSHFGVEESTGSVYKVTSDEPEERVSYSQEATVLRIEGRQSSSRRPLLTHHQLHQQQQQPTQQDSFAEASQEFASQAVVQPVQQQPLRHQLSQQIPQRTEQQNQQTNIGGQQVLEKLTSPAPPVKIVDTRSPDTSHQTVPNYSQAQALTYHPVDLQTHPGSAPVTYETSVTSATSGSRVQFYSEPPGYRIQTADKRKDRRFDLNQFQEKVYAQPEKNYEVDEAVSVLTNGRAHGVQQHNAPPQNRHHHQPQPTSGVSTVQTPEAQDGLTVPAIKPPGDSGKDEQDDDDDNNKFGYVVDDRNYRKYRVEEKTPDGFIVGEYGVVSHDDGSLRGVRYTADSTINPRLIYDALVKFLSLK